MVRLRGTLFLANKATLLFVGRLIPTRQQTLRHNLKSNKVEQLKQILTGLNEECHTNLTKTGKKQDLIDKITRELDDWRRSDNVERWSRAKGIMSRVRQTG